MLRIGTATKHSNETRGFHAPGTTGPFGAAVAAGRLLQFDSAKMTNVIGIAGSLAGGLVQFARAGTGAMVKRLHFGRAGESGVLAANLADRGFDGPHDVLEGEFGFLHVFCDERDVSALTRGLGETFLCLNIYMKRFACHGSSHGFLKAIEELRAAHSFTASDIDSIDIDGSADVIERHGSLTPADPMQAQYSVPFCVALAFFRDPRDPRSFDQTALNDENIRSLSKRVHITVDDKASRTKPSDRIVLHLRNGRVLTHEGKKPEGKAHHTLDRDDVHEKFSLLTSHCPSDKMEEIFNRLQTLETESDFDWLKL
jgi:2-methylcitrate dehydratase PrpD